jgi:hypothetical protein
MPRSEQAAWLMVKEIANEVARMVRGSSGRIDAGRLSMAAEDLIGEADKMLAQLKSGIHENPSRRKNPALIVWPNPGSELHVKPFRLLSHQAIALAYKHTDDGEDYEHDFARGVQIVAGTLDTGQRVVILTRPDGKEVWELF